MSDRYYLEHPLAPGTVVVRGAEAHHLAHVCRVQVGESVYLFNGDGRQYLAQVLGADKRNVTLEVTQVEEPMRELGFRLIVAAPLPKGDRAQFLLEKLTELGVTDFVPLRTARSVVHPRETDKLTRYVIEASKQCGRNTLLRVAPLTEWNAYLQQTSLPAHRLLADVAATEVIGDTTPSDVVLAVGPEGGWTEKEVQGARNHGWQTVSLGPRILRVETAALVLAVRVVAKRDPNSPIPAPAAP